MLTAGRNFLERKPAATDDELRGYLYREFLVERDAEIALLRSRLWPVALIVRLFRRSTAERAKRLRESVEETIRNLRHE